MAPSALPTYLIWPTGPSTHYHHLRLQLQLAQRCQFRHFRRQRQRRHWL